jgi:Tfp pilus assembly protein FimT
MRFREWVRRERSSEAGISVVEIVIIGMITASIVALAIPSVSTAIRGYNVRSAAAHVAERMSAVRALAMAKNKSVTFSFNSASRSFGFDFTGPEGDGVPDSSDPDDTESRYLIERLSSGMEVTFPDSEDIKVTFNSRGEMPIGSMDKSVLIQNSGKSATVRVNLRGKVWIE